MKQATLGLNLDLKKTRKRQFLEQMDQVVPWAALVELIAPYYPEGRTGRPPFSLQTMLRTHLHSSNGSPCQTPPWKKPSLTHRCTGSLPSSKSSAACPTSPPSCAYQHRLEEHKLAEQILQTVNELLTERGLLLKVGTAIDATLIAAPISTKNKNKARDPEMHSSKKGNQWYFGMKAHIGVDADSGLVHSVRGTSGHVSDIAEGNSLLHGQETLGFGDAGYEGIEKRPDAKMGITWHIAMRPGKRKS